MFLSINIARLHPLLVHLPIGILIFAAVLEVLKWRTRNQALDVAIQAALFIGFFSALFAGATGWFLSDEGGYDETMLWQHQWSGIGLIVFSLLLYFSKTTKISFFKKIYRFLFAIVLLLLFLAGHFGGNLTHGSDYLFSKPEDASISIADIEEAKVFPMIIEPILKVKCNSCHNASKAKGDLIMTSPAGLLAGGKTGMLFNFEQVMDSELLRRIHLEKEEKEHMPPKGKKQLSSDEEKLLLWWIENKACIDCLVRNMKNRAPVASILEKYKTQDSDLTRLKVDPIKKEVFTKIKRLGLKINSVSEESPFLIVNLSDKEKLDRSELALLKNIGENIVELNLANTNFSDHYSALFRAMPHLKKLQVQRTAIGKDAIDQLGKMKYLSSLNIYDTKLTDAVIKTLKDIPSLKSLYCWQTKMSEQGILDLQTAMPKLYINYKMDKSLFDDSKLNAPVILAAEDLFSDSLGVKFETNVKNVRFFYTLDGSDPDTTSKVVADSFYLTNSAMVKVIAQAKSWGISPVAKRQFIQTKIKIKAAKLAKSPNDSYKAEGANSLIDLKKGTEAIKGGNWLGYQGEHVEASLELAQEASIKKLLVSSFSAPLSWIFLPKKIKVWTSLNGRQYILQKEEDYPAPLPNSPQELKYLELNFEPSLAKFVKVKLFSVLKNPDWHPSPGEACWIFVDEILVE